MASYGYARVTTTVQDLSGQRKALERAGCRVIRAETASGSSAAGRGELRTVLDFLGPGDELVVTRVDRLARSVGDLQDVVRELRAKGASLRCTEQPVDASTARIGGLEMREGSIGDPIALLPFKLGLMVDQVELAVVLLHLDFSIEP